MSVCFYRVMNEKYAFFAESTTIDYTTERNCEVTRVRNFTVKVV